MIENTEMLHNLRVVVPGSHCGNMFWFMSMMHQDQNGRFGTWEEQKRKQTKEQKTQ